MVKVSFGLVLISTVLGINYAQNPLQYEREHGFPFHSKSSEPAPSSVLNSFTKARLPTSNVIPSAYVLEITPVLDDDLVDVPKFTAPGWVRITVKPPTEGIQNITLNNVGILVLEDFVTVTAVGETTPETINRQITEPSNEFFIIEMATPLDISKEYEIFIRFTAKVETDPSKLNGLYLSTFTKPDGTTSNIATTQMEATAARQAFPCFDEPWIKATFTISIGHHNKYTAYANTEQVGPPQEHPDFGAEGYLLSSFASTGVPMSTYLVAMIVAEFSCETVTDPDFGKPTGICGPPHLIDDLQGGVYSAQKSAELLKFFETHYEIEYKLNKMDSMAVANFEFGAMENWGLNIYRDYLLLYYPDVGEMQSTEAERQRITIILAHELAHQWFGNLVTTEFWNFIWLNEGFATYNEYIATEAVSPEFEALSLRQNDAFQAALIYDANFNDELHPLVNGANGDHTNKQLMDGIFDQITYEKGGSLIRMMEGFLGSETLRQGLIAYLNERSFKGANQNQLFEHLTTQAHSDGKLPADKSVKDIMDTWSLQTGFPLIRVTTASDSVIYVSQERFTPEVKYTEGDDGPMLDPNDLWEVPIAIATPDNPEFTNHTPAFWIPKTVALKTANFDTTKWIYVNTDSVGFFRVLYDSPLFNLLVQQLSDDHLVFSDVSRSQLIDDYFTFAWHKFSNIENALDLTKYLGNELKLVVWNTAFRHLRTIYNKIIGTEYYGDFKNYLLPRLESILDKYGWDHNSEYKGANVSLRTQLLDWACALESTRCREYGLTLFDQLTADPEPALNPVPIDQRQILYCGAVAAGGKPTLDKAIARYVASTSAKEKPMLLNSFTCAVENVDLLFLLGKILAPASEIASSDKIRLLQNLAANPTSRPHAINFVRTNSATIIDDADLGTGAIVSFIETLATYLSTPVDLDQVKEIIENTDSSMSDAQRARLQTLSGTISTNIKWMEDYGERLGDWFATNSNN